MKNLPVKEQVLMSLYSGNAVERYDGEFTRRMSALCSSVGLQLELGEPQNNFMIRRVPFKICGDPILIRSVIYSLQLMGA